MNDKIRYSIAVILVLLIIGVGIYAYMNKESLFRNEVVIQYGDGCNETYINGELINPICENGRLMDELNSQNNIPNNINGVDGNWQLNLTNLN